MGKLFLAGACTALLAGPAHAVNIDWVQVGNPGNAPDTASNCSAFIVAQDPNCGSVPHTYYISKYDTTNAQYAEFLNAVDPTGSNTLGLYSAGMGTDPNNGGITNSGPSGSVYQVKTGFASDPVVYVSFYDALRFANWLNNGQGNASTETGAYTLLGGTSVPSNDNVTRNAGATVFLPSVDEWYKAAYFNPISGSYFAYPYGTSTPTVCAAPGPTPNTANCNNVVGKVTPVGAYTGSASPYGAYDMGGNVDQWNEQFGRDPIIDTALRGLRGGAWDAGADRLAASAEGIVELMFSQEGGDAGFRVASLVPEPGTGLLVMTGLLGLAARHRRA